MIDQSHNIEGKIDAMIHSVVNIQTAYAKALLVDADRLARAQREGDVLGAHRVLMDASRRMCGRCSRSCARDSASRGPGRGVPPAVTRSNASPSGARRSVESAYEKL